MYPVLIKIGKFQINSWGFMMLIAILLSIWGISRLFKKQGYNDDIVVELVVLSALAGVIGSRLAYLIIYEWQEFLLDPLATLIPSGGISGMIWYGGFLGGFIVFFLYMRKYKLEFWKISDIFAPFLALSYAIVRIGCFLAGCCYGQETNSACGVVFPYVDALTRHPTQLYSSLLNFMLFLFLIWFYPRRRFDGEVFLLYLIGYSIYRFIIEYFRENIIFYGPLSMGQVYTLGLLLIAAVIYWWRYKYSKKSSLL